MRAGLFVAFVVGWCAVAGAQPSQAPAPSSNAELDKIDAELRTEYAKFPAPDYATQEKLTRRALDAQRKLSGEDSVYTWRREIALMDVLQHMQDHTRAIEMLEKMLAKAERLHGKDSEDVRSVLGWMIGSYQMAFTYQDELDALFARKLALTKKLWGEKSGAYLGELNGYAFHLSGRGNVIAAIRVLEEQIRLTEAAGQNPDYSMLGMMYMQVDQAKAKQAFDKHLASLKSQPIATQTHMYWWVSGFWRRANRLDLAAPIEKQALEMARKEVARVEKEKGDSDELVNALFNLGGMLLEQNDLKAAEPVLERHVAVQEKLKSKFIQYGQLGWLRRKQGRIKEAYALYEKSQKVFGGTGMYSMMGDMQRELGNTKKAEELYLAARADLDKYFGKKAILVNRLDLGLYAVYVAAKKLDKAEKILDEHFAAAERDLAFVLAAGTEADHLAFFQREQLLDVAIGFHASIAPKRPAAARMAMTTILRRKGRILDAAAASLNKLRARLPAEDKKLLAELELARAKLAKVAVQGSQANPNFAKEVAALEEQIQKLEVTLAKKSADLKLALSTVTLADVQKRIPKAAKLVEIVNYQPSDPTAKYEVSPKLAPRRYVAYVVGDKGDPALVDLGDVQPIDDAIVKLRTALADPDNTEATNLAKALYTQTFGKLTKALGSAKQILIAPDGALNVVPFAALHDGKKFLVEMYTFTYLTSGRDLLHEHAKAKGKGAQAVIFADPDFDTAPAKGAADSAQRRSRAMQNLTWPRLPGTAAEADALEKTLIKPTVYRGKQATESTLKGLQAPPILHLATHGFFLADADASVENPLLRSGLVFAGANGRSSNNDDGVVTALEASGLDLRGTQLVVMSACETGVGKLTNGEGVYGLRRALVIAGAESLVMSMWQVDDAATKDLMAGYYKKLQDGLGRSEALRAIQRDLAAKPKYAHPYYWASFIAAGDSSPLGK